MSQNGFPDAYQPSAYPEGTMDLFIETLTGTAFEMTVSPFDTIIAIKTKIQRVEGIPVSHQHLLYNLRELDDSSSLMDHSIQNGATLKLVLSLRGGPISTRRVHSEDELSWKEIRDLMENNICEHKRDDVFDSIPPGCKITVLVFREGDQVNLFRVLENEDGTFSPLSDSLSGSSIQSLFVEDDPEETAQRLRENTHTMYKMQELRKKMDALSLKKPKTNTSCAASAKQPAEVVPSSIPDLPAHSRPQATATSTSGTRQQQLHEALHLPPIQKAPATSVANRRAGSYLDHSSMMNPQIPRRTRGMPARGLGRFDNNHNIHPQLPRASKRETKDASLPRRPPLVPLCPLRRPNVRRRANRLAAGHVVDARPSECMDYGTNRALFRHNPPSSAAASTDNSSAKSSSLLSTSKIAVVETENESTLDKVESNFGVNPNPIPIPIPSNEATTCTIARERVSTSVGAGAGRYRLSEVVLDDDRPKTSPDKLTQQQKRAQGICDLLSETKWHRRQPRINCPSIEDLTTDTAAGKQHTTLIKDKEEHAELPLDLPLSDCSVLDGPLLSTPNFLQYSQRGLLLPLVNNSSRVGDPRKLPKEEAGESKAHPEGRRKGFSETVPANAESESLPLIAPLANSGSKKIRQRCAECRKRLTLTTVYSCRCEKLFCAAHRYSELHNCTFDYKAEGRKLLEQANPLVTAPKLPKI